MNSIMMTAAVAAGVLLSGCGGGAGGGATALGTQTCSLELSGAQTSRIDCIVPMLFADAASTSFRLDFTIGGPRPERSGTTVLTTLSFTGAPTARRYDPSDANESDGSIEVFVNARTGVLAWKQPEGSGQYSLTLDKVAKLSVSDEGSLYMAAGTLDARLEPVGDSDPLMFHMSF
jgi:hypothetical protein